MLLACLLCLHACTRVQPSWHEPSDHNLTIRPATELQATPFFPQTMHQCGPAALATVLKSYQLDVTPEALSSQLYIPARHGSLQIELVTSARRHSMLPYQLDTSLQDLLIEVAAGHHVLVMQNLAVDWWHRWHYAVVIGYDLDSQEIVLRSGKTERWVTTFAAFENTWQRAGRWALVIVPLGQIPATATLPSYLKTAYAFEEIGLTREAARAYHAAVERWPEHPAAWMMLGTSAYANGEYAEAVSALMAASRLDPNSAALWNNLAYALHAVGCAEQSNQSLRCAYRMSVDHSNIRDSEQQLNQRARPARLVAHCPKISCD